jgi:hypothetical protein
VLAGLCLGLSFMTRTTTALAVVFFVVEALRTHRRPEPAVALGQTLRVPEPSATPAAQLWRFVRGADWPKVLRAGVWLSLPVPRGCLN